MNKLGIKLFLEKAKLGANIVICYLEQNESERVSGEIVELDETSITVKCHLFGTVFSNVEVPFKNIWSHSLEG
ncbi:hypothetical protein [Bacillus thuringiensis]|uniref:Uncharacterized protein n=1 Tax=Bacillus thuringiensis subsp. jegathesan TaxID=56955 RepID=A0A9X6MIP9_BACTJ|nr:hypothetical protein [Bacillus thuringiensis]OUB78428.1 hypothetical protein BK750_00120 [Bacillus thuringiensis serovar jegathesan]